LHNWDEISRKDIKIGDTVLVERAGDVIPHVIKVIEEKRTGNEKSVPIPPKCPECGSQVVREEGEVAVRCIGLNCPAQVQEKIIHFASRGAMDIEGLGEKNVALLYSKGLISHFIDIYQLKKEDLMALPRFAEKSSQNLVDAIEKSKNTTLARFIYALGILHVGEFASKLLARNFAKIDALFHINPGEILQIKQMGEKIAYSISAFFHDQKNLNTLKKLKSFGLRISNPDFEGTGKKKKPLTGITFVITGTLPKQRNEVEELIESLGGHVTSSVSKNTDYVIAGDSPGSKFTKAKTLGVRIISYEDFFQLTQTG
jgi:DNA ligase (NAD+)